MPAPEWGPDFSFFWAIRNVSDLCLRNLVESPAFTAKSLEATKWKLRLVSVEYKLRRIILEILREKDDDGPDGIELDLEFALLGANRSPLAQITASRMFSKNICHWFEFPYYEEVLGERKAEFLPTDVLTVRCRMWGKERRSEEENACFVCTLLERDRRCFVWAISGFSTLQLGQKRTRIMESHIKGSPTLILTLSLVTIDFETYICIKIDRTSGKAGHRIVGGIALLDAEGAVLHFEKVRRYMPKTRRNIWASDKFFEQKKIISDASNMLPNDVLHLRCEFDISCDPIWSETESQDPSCSREPISSDSSEAFPLHSEIMHCEKLNTSEPMSMHMGELSSVMSDIAVDETNKSISEVCPVMEIIKETSSREPISLDSSETILLQREIHSEGLDSSAPMSMHVSERPVKSDISVDETNESVSKVFPVTEFIRESSSRVPISSDSSETFLLQSEKLDSSEPMSMHASEKLYIKNDIAADETNKSVTEKCPFTEIIKEFYNKSTLTDVVLQTRSESFRVHKVVLCCRSAVFATMFADDAHEDTKHCFEISDVNIDTLQQLLLFMYTSEVPKVQWEGAADLFRVANTYELFDLKQKCAEILKLNICKSNLCIILLLAYRYRENELLKVALDFISENSDIFESEEWETFKNLNSEFASETMKRVIYKLTNHSKGS